MKNLIILLSILALTSKEKIFCDIKGNVNNPGVYEIKENYTIQDIIKDAGGLKKDSYTKNINLSKKVKDEMVIYIFNNSEIKEIEELNNCICKPIYNYTECQKKEDKIVKTTNPTTNSTTKKTSTAEPQTTTIKSKTTSIASTAKTTTKTTTLNEIPQSKPITTTKPITTIKVKININNATLEELETLNGLGTKKAEAIIEYRINIGLFNTIEDIMNVSGIGKSTFEKIKEDIEV